MSQAKHYIICVADNVDTFEQEVNKRIAEGYRPLGGVSGALSESDDYKYQMFCQAMLLAKPQHSPDCGTKYRGCAPDCKFQAYYDDQTAAEF